MSGEIYGKHVCNNFKITQHTLEEFLKTNVFKASNKIIAKNINDNNISKI
jgi:hypothetical protein